MPRRLALFALLLMPIVTGCDSNPGGPSSPPATAGPSAPGSESETAPPKEPKVKTEGGPASEK